MLGALALVALIQAEPPKTVNGDVLGPPEDFATRGPATVCLRNVAVTARQGETVYLSYAGIHSGKLRLVIGQGYADVTHGEAFVEPKGPLASIEDKAGWRVYRTRRAGKPALVVLRRGTGTSPNPQIWIDGPAVADRTLLQRISVSDDDAKGCDRIYTYGWTMLLGDEPVSRKGDR